MDKNILKKAGGYLLGAAIVLLIQQYVLAAGLLPVVWTIPVLNVDVLALAVVAASIFVANLAREKLRLE